MPTRVKAGFIEPMLLLRTDTLPDEAARWAYQLKFDGYRAIAFKTGGKVYLRSRNDNDFGVRYPAVVRGWAKLPDETVIDGELGWHHSADRSFFSRRLHITDRDRRQSPRHPRYIGLREDKLARDVTRK
jgi:ATP-dependent DNA ligase